MGKWGASSVWIADPTEYRTPGTLAGTAEASKKPVTQITQATNAPGIVRGLAQGPAQGLLWVACEVGDAGVKPGRAREKKGAAARRERANIRKGNMLKFLLQIVFSLASW